VTVIKTTEEQALWIYIHAKKRPKCRVADIM